MKEIVVEFFYLNELPKRFEDIKLKKNSKIDVFQIDDRDSLYTRILKHIEYSFNLKGFRIYHKDNTSKQLLELKDACDLERACFIESKFIEICIIDNISNNKIFPKHLDVLCSSCRCELYGIRYVCMQCNDYNLCEDCKIKKIHSFHEFVPCPSVYGYSVCDDCYEEIKTQKIVCLDCSNKRVPLINEFKGNKTIRWINYLICDKCKLKYHMSHTMRINLVSDINNLHDKLLKELKEKRATKEIIKFYDCGIPCFICKKTGVVFQCGTLNFLDILLCDECLENGAFRNQLTFKWLTPDEANQLRSENNRLKKIQRETLLRLKSKSTNDLIRKQFSSLNIDM